MAAGAEDAAGEAPKEMAVRSVAADPDHSTAEPPEDLAATVIEARAEWRRSKPIPHSQERSLTTRFETAVTCVVERYPAAFSGTDLDPERHLAALERLCEKVEATLKKEAESQETDVSPAEILARQLREALATNTMGARIDPESKRQADAEIVKRLQAERRALGPVPGETGQQLSERFQSACDRFFQQNPSPAIERKARSGNRRRR